MGNFADRIEVAAGDRNVNVLAGSAFEFIGARAARVVVGLASEFGINNPPDQLATVLFGPEVQLQRGVIPREKTLGEGVGESMVLVDDFAAPGDRLVVELVNDGAANVEISVVVRIIPQ